MKRTVYAALPGMAQAKSVEMATSLMLLSLAEDGRVGHIPCALVRRYGVTKTDPTAHYNAVQTHLAAYKSGRVQVEPANISSRPLSVSWRAAHPEAPIAAIIPTRNNGADLDRAISSLKAKAAAPDSLQIVVVDNGSSDAATRAALERLAKEGTKVIAIDEPFNWSRLNNQAMAQMDDPLLLFVNDDVTMLTDGWDQILRGLPDRSEVGALGAKKPSTALSQEAEVGVKWKWNRGCRSSC